MTRTRTEDTTATIWIEGGSYPHHDGVFSFVGQTGRSVWGGETVAQLRAKYPGSTVLVMPFKLAYERQHRVDEARLCLPWLEITEDQWDEALNVLPPENWQQTRGLNCFRMCEYMTGNFTGHYIRIFGRHFTAIREARRDYEPYAQEIRAQFAF